MEKKNIWLDGVMGLVVGDALGVPVEFRSRWELKQAPVETMRAYGTYNQPAGTWSDDSSMVLATVDALKAGYDLERIMDNFVRWIIKADYTPFQSVFDKGVSTYMAIERYIEEGNLSTCGGDMENDNGNGSLMRMIPICLFAYEQQKKNGISNEEAIDMIHEVSALTHAHIRSLVACGLYFFMVKAILDGVGEILDEEGEAEVDVLNRDTLKDFLQKGMNEGFAFYEADGVAPDELQHYERIRNLETFAETEADDIDSSGYVVSSLEAALWCLLNTDCYKECVLKAVNLGKDTDTVAAIAGGLAGLFYGYEAIPEEWMGVIQRREWMEELVGKVEE